LTSRRAFIGTLASGLVLAPFAAESQRPTGPKTLLSFTRGQWTAYGTNTFQDVIYRDRATGQHMGQIKGAPSGSPDVAFVGWCTADYDTDRDELPILLCTGHSGWSSNEVNTFAMKAGAWRHDFDPTVSLIPSYAQPYAPGTGVGTRMGGTPFYIDVNNKYPDHAELDSQGRRAYPNMRQSYGCSVYMPSVKRHFLWGGFVWWDTSVASVPCEYDPATKRYRSLDLDAGFSYNGHTPYGCWDPVQARVLFHDNDNLWAYYPTRPFGQRVVSLQSRASEINNANALNHMLFDSKRNRAVVIGRDAVEPRKGGVVIYDFSKNPLAVSRQVVTSLTGDTAFVGVPGPGGRYDPLADLYVVWNGGKSLWVIKPSTWACTLFTPTGGDTPSIPVVGESPGGGTWHRFFYSPTYDVFGVVNHANEPAYIFAPTRA
jgi:hypothetical protein